MNNVCDRPFKIPARANGRKREEEGTYIYRVVSISKIDGRSNAHENPSSHELTKRMLEL